jgi:hypothetical protein
MSKASAYTSTRQIPAAFKEESLATIFTESGHNLDWGGGKFDDASAWLQEKYGCLNSIYDPYNRSLKHNLEVLRGIDWDVNVKSITCLNVLNVIQDKDERKDLLEGLAYLGNNYISIKHVILQVFSGNNSGVPSTGKISQNNLPLKEYMGEIREAFPQQLWNALILGSKKNILVLQKGSCSFT